MAIPIYESRPYSNPQRTARMSDLMRTEAAIRGNAEMEGAEASGRMWAGIGNTVADLANTYARAEMERPQRELREAQASEAKQKVSDKKQITEVLKLTRDPETGQLDLRAAAKEIAHIDPAQAQEFFTAASAQDKAQLLANRERLEQLGQFAGGVLLDLEKIAPPDRPGYIKERAQSAIQMGLIRDEDVPDEITESQLRAAFQTTLKTTDLARMLAEQGKPPGTREIKVRNPDGSETIQIVPDTPGQTFSSAPDAPKRHMVTVPGPGGTKVQRLATEEELEAGVTAYREPERPERPTETTLSQRAQAERWKQDALAAVEREFRNPKTDPFTGEPVAPMSKADLEARKADIQQSYLQQIGAPAPTPSSGPPAATPPAAEAAATPPARPPAPALQVGQVVSARGQRVRITKVYPDGTFDAEPVP